MSGPPPKPTERRQRRNIGPRLGLVSSAPATAPPAPSGLLKATREAWDALWASPLAQFLDPVTDGPVLRRLWSLYDERERAYRGYRRARLVEGSQGQLVLNPLGRLMMQMDAEIRQLEDRIGLSPRARLQLGITLGEAARSLADLNRALEIDDDDDDADPRLYAIS